MTWRDDVEDDLAIAEGPTRCGPQSGQTLTTMRTSRLEAAGIAGRDMCRRALGTDGY
jgi:hypothetical protein